MRALKRKRNLGACQFWSHRIQVWLYLRSNDGNSKADLVQTASESVAGSICDVLVATSAKSSTSIAGFITGCSVAKRTPHVVASARSGSIACHNSNGNECAAKEDIEDNCEECEEALSSKTARQDNGEDGVYNANSTLESELAVASQWKKREI